MKYRAKPKEVNAVKWTGSNLREVCQFCGCEEEDIFIQGELYLPSNYGSYKVPVGDYIVEDLIDKYRLCKASIFESIYDKVG